MSRENQQITQIAQIFFFLFAPSSLRVFALNFPRRRSDA